MMTVQYLDMLKDLGHNRPTALYIDHSPSAVADVQKQINEGMSCLVLSCRVLSCLVWSGLVLSGLVLSWLCLGFSCLLFSSLVFSCLLFSSLVLLVLVLVLVLVRVLSCRVVSCRVVSCRVVSWSALLCSALLLSSLVCLVLLCPVLPALPCPVLFLSCPVSPRLTVALARPCPAFTGLSPCRSSVLLVLSCLVWFLPFVVLSLLLFSCRHAEHCGSGKKCASGCPNGWPWRWIFAL